MAPNWHAAPVLNGLRVPAPAVVLPSELVSVETVAGALDQLG